MLSNFWSPRGRRIAYIILACLIPAVLLIAIFNFIQYEQQAATKNIPVAVVNNDQAADDNGQTINMGQQVVETLKKDHQVKWEFVSAATAKKQLANGDAYLEIELPKDFSKNATTVLAKHPQVSLIKLHESKRNNFLSTMVTNTVAQTVQAQVKTKVQKVYSASLLSGLKQLGDGTKQAAAGTNQLNDGMVQLKDGNQEVARNLNVLATKMVTFSAGAKTLSSGINTYTAGVDTLAAANKQMLAGLQELQTKAEPLVSGTAQLATGSQSLATGVQQYTSGVSTMNAANKQVLGGLSQLNGQSKTLGSATTQLTAGSTSLLNGTQAFKTQFDAGVGQLQNGIAGSTLINTTVAEMKTARQKSDNVQTEMASLQSGVDMLNQVLPMLNTLSASKTKISSLQTEMNLMAKLAPSTDKVKTDQADANSKQKTLSDAINALPDDDANKANLQALAQQSTTATTKIGSDAQSAANAFSIVKTQSTSALDEFSTELDAASSLNTADAGKLMTSIQQLETDAADLFDYTDNNLLSDEKINELQHSTDSITAGLQQLQQKSDSGLGSLVTGSTQLAAGNKQLSTSAPTLISAISQLFTGEQQVVAGGNQLDANTASLVSGALAVASGNATLASSAPALVSGVNQLVNGASQVNNGSNKLTAASAQLNAGADQLTTGAQQAQSGASQLASGSNQVQAGLVTAADGVATLNSKLTAGANQIGTVNDGSGNVNHIATPISNQEVGNDQASLKNVFAPLVLALVLFLAAVVTQLGLFMPHRKLHTLMQEPLLAIGLTALAQAVIADVVIAMLGITVANWFGLTVFTIAVAFIFTMICMILYHMFGRVGVLFAVLLALVQVIVTGQVFPNAMLSSFYQVTANVLPMTYAIHGFETLINGASYSVWGAVALLIIFTAILGGIAYLIDVLIQHRNVIPSED